MIIFELKKYLSLRMLFSLAAGLTVCLAVFFLANQIGSRKSIIEPFEVVIVDQDNSMETNMLINILAEREEFADFIYVSRGDLDTARQRLGSGEIPAYLVIPENFAEDIKSGVNTPFTVVGSLDRPLQLAAARILTESGVAFLSSSQSGIYSTIDYAFENGMSFEEIQAKLVMPINLKFAMRLLSYEDFFNTAVVSQTPIPLGKHYFLSFAFFFALINIPVYASALAFNKNIFGVYRVAGFSLARLTALRFFGVFTANCLLCLPFAFVLGAAYLLVALLVASLALLVLTIVPEESAGLIMFVTAGVMLFVSGGIIPVVYLPKVFERLQLFTLNYWVLSLAKGFAGGWMPSALVMVPFCGACYGLTLAYCKAVVR